MPKKKVKVKIKTTHTTSQMFFQATANISTTLSLLKQLMSLIYITELRIQSLTALMAMVRMFIVGAPTSFSAKDIQVPKDSALRA